MKAKEKIEERIERKKKSLKRQLLQYLLLLVWPTSPNTHPLPELPLSLELIRWHHEVWSNSGSKSWNKLLLKSKPCRLGWDHTSSALIIIQLLIAKPRWTKMITHRVHCRAQKPRGSDLSKLCPQNNEKLYWIHKRLKCV